MTIPLAAQIIFETRRVYSIHIGDPAPHPHWEEVPTDRRERFTSAVEAIALGQESGAAQCHERWVAQKQCEGWSYGPDYDAAAKVHPHIIPYDNLPDVVKLKDQLIVDLVSTLQGL